MRCLALSCMSCLGLACFVLSCRVLSCLDLWLPLSCFVFVLYCHCLFRSKCCFYCYFYWLLSSSIYIHINPYENRRRSGAYLDSFHMTTEEDDSKVSWPCLCFVSVLSCLCPVLSCLILRCLVYYCIALSCPVCLVLSCLVLSWDNCNCIYLVLS